jgi:glyoxylase-like metal-dependent hydrolase (beta-lactamase superfamily II)
VALIKEDLSLFSGDTLLERTIPTSGLHFVEDEVKTSNSLVSNYSHWPSLPAFIHSVNEIQKQHISTIYPGHGPRIDNPARVFQRFLKHHEKRGRRINLFLENNKDHSPYMIAKLMFPRVSDQQIVQAMIEIIGHLDLRTISEGTKPI